MSIAEPNAPPVEYPSGDGQPMAETGLHVRAITLLHQALEDFFRDRKDVYIASDQFWYWKEGHPELRISPDVMVATGVSGEPPRRSFLSWEEGGAIPAVVFEMASEGTWRDDVDDKYDRYEQLGVREYFLFDPEGLYLVPRLQGYRLNGTAYRRMRQTELTSELGFGLRSEEMMIRLIDLKTGLPLPTRAEAVESERLRADAQQQRADTEQQRADAEKARADSLQAEIERLRAMLPKPDASGGGA